MAIGAGISAGGSLVSGIFGGKAASKAAAQQAAAEQQVAQLATTAATNAQTGVTDAANTGATSLAGATTAGQGDIAAGIGGANSTLSSSLDSQLALLQPYISQGGTSLSQLQQLTGPGGPLTQQFTAPTTQQLNDPNNPNAAGYQFTLNQGQQAIDRSAAAQGGLFSTGTAKSLAGYTAGTASQYAQQAYNNALSTFNTNRQGTLSQISALQNLTGLGYSAAGGAANATGQAGAQQAQNTLAGANQIAGVGLTGTQASTNLAYQGASQSGQFGLEGAQIAGTALAGAGNAQAAGTVGSTNAWLNALSGGTNALSGYQAYSNGYSPYGGYGGYGVPTSVPDIPNPYLAGETIPSLPGLPS